MERCVKLYVKPFYMHIPVNSHNTQKKKILYLADKKIENDLPTQGLFKPRSGWFLS